jgi:hypothetical protein
MKHDDCHRVTRCLAGNWLKNGSELQVDENWMRVLKMRANQVSSKSD